MQPKGVSDASLNNLTTQPPAIFRFRLKPKEAIREEVYGRYSVLFRFQTLHSSRYVLLSTFWGLALGHAGINRITASYVSLIAAPHTQRVIFGSCSSSNMMVIVALCRSPSPGFLDQSSLGGHATIASRSAQCTQRLSLHMR